MELTKDQKSLLLFLETQVVDHGGKIYSPSMNALDRMCARRWATDGFIEFGRIPVRKITSHRCHWARLSDAAWEIVHQLRRERAERNLYPKAED